MSRAVEQRVASPANSDHEIDIERNGFSPDTLRLLQARGHKLKEQGYWSDGECIAVDPKTGELLGAPDGRNGGKAAGF